MPKTLFLTGASAGIGRATAQRFQAAGWNVAATMRNPGADTALAGLDRVARLRCDVTESASIHAAVEATLECFGGIDVLVNNAGYGCYGPLEVTPREKIVAQLETNVVGLLETTKAVVPHFRARQAGTIINVSSMGGRVAGPFATLYYASKFAVEGLSESLCFEMAAIGVRVKIVEPGMVASDFNDRSMDFSNEPAIAEYQPAVDAVMKSRSAAETYRSDSALPADIIYQAATDGSDRLRYPSGDDARAIAARLEEEGSEAILRERLPRYGLRWPGAADAHGSEDKP